MCLTIDEFIKKFPNLIQYERLIDANIFEIQRELEFCSKINSYLNIVKNNLDKKSITGLYEKIYDYLMSEIFDKIYPEEPNDIDIKIFKQSIKLSWTEPEHFINKYIRKPIVFRHFFSDVYNYLKLIDTEKSPRIKILNMKKFFDSIEYLLKFNEILPGSDDIMPILEYVIVKAQIPRIFSNVKFMELYIGEKINQSQARNLRLLSDICTYIAKKEYSELIDVENKGLIEADKKMLDLEKTNENLIKNSDNNLNIEEDDNYNKINQKNINFDNKVVEDLKNNLKIEKDKCDKLNQKISEFVKDLI